MPSILPFAQTRGFVYNQYKWFGGTPRVIYYVNLNSAQMDGDDGSIDDFLTAIFSAAETWNQAPDVNIQFVYGGLIESTEPSRNGINEIMFRALENDRTVAEYQPWIVAESGEIVEADMWFNENIDWDTTGSPSRDEVDLQSVATHEFGHWLSLGHDPSSLAVMYWGISKGSVKWDLHTSDIEGIQYIYGLNPQATLTPASTPAPTIAPTNTPIPTIMPTNTPIPTIMPTNTPIPTIMPTNTPIRTEGRVFLPLISR